MSNSKLLYFSTHSQDIRIPYTGVFADIYFLEFCEFLLVAKICREILGVTPSSHSAPTWVRSGFGLITKIFFAKFAAISNSRKYRSANHPGYTVYTQALRAALRTHICVANFCSSTKIYIANTGNSHRTVRCDP